MSSHLLDQLLHEYGCALVFAVVALQALGVPLPGTTALIAAALYAATAHGLPITGVIAAGALGALAGTAGSFAIGRWRGDQLLTWAGGRLRQSPQRVAALRDEFARHGGLLLFVARFVTGLRNVAGLLAGAGGMPVRRFALAAALSCTVWALVNGLEYYFFGHALAAADTWLQVLLIALGIAWLIVSVVVIRRRALRRLGAIPALAEPEQG